MTPTADKTQLPSGEGNLPSLSSQGSGRKLLDLQRRGLHAEMQVRFAPGVFGKGVLNSGNEIHLV